MPDTYLPDVFARPVNLLTAHPSVDIRCTIDAAGAPGAPVRITAALSRGTREIADHPDLGRARVVLNVTPTGRQRLD